MERSLVKRSLRGLLILLFCGISLLGSREVHARNYSIDFTFDFLPIPPEDGEAWFYGVWTNKGAKGIRDIDTMTILPDTQMFAGAAGMSQNPYIFLGRSETTALFMDSSPYPCGSIEDLNCVYVEALTPVIVTSEGSAFVDKGEVVLLLNSCGVFPRRKSTLTEQLRDALGPDFSCKKAWDGDFDYWFNYGSFFTRKDPLRWHPHPLQR